MWWQNLFSRWTMPPRKRHTCQRTTLSACCVSSLLAALMMFCIVHFALDWQVQYLTHVDGLERNVLTLRWECLSTSRVNVRWHVCVFNQRKPWLGLGTPVTTAGPKPQWWPVRRLCRGLVPGQTSVKPGVRRSTKLESLHTSTWTSVIQWPCTCTRRLPTATRRLHDSPGSSSGTHQSPAPFIFC